MSLLDRIESPADLKTLARRASRVSQEMRERLIDVCSRTGGHIGAGLGVVELTVALHTCSTRRATSWSGTSGTRAIRTSCSPAATTRMETLRQEDGLSGFLKRSESEYDTFGAGHAATSISAALGMAAARDITGDDYKVVAVLGDGALTSGLAYEGLNNAGHSERDIIVVLNDNEMSIAPNVGAMSKYLTSIQRNPLYNRVRARSASRGQRTGHPSLRTRSSGSGRRASSRSSRPACCSRSWASATSARSTATTSTAWSDMLAAVRGMTGPRLVHVITQKGKGFPAGEHRREVARACRPGTIRRPASS